MHLVADRFLVGGSGRAIDVWSGALVMLRVRQSSANEPRWVERCSALSTLRHSHLVPLVDHGPLGRREHFEAFAGTSQGAWPADDRRAQVALQRVARFLERLDLSVSTGVGRVVAWNDRPAVMPGQLTGAPCGTERREARKDGSSNLSDRHRRFGVDGTVLQPSSSLRAIAEWLDVESARRLRVLGVHGPRGSGLRTTMALAAREARIRGFVPVSSRWFGDDDGGMPLVARWIRRLALERHVFVVHDATDPDNERRTAARLGRVLLQLGVAKARQHALVIVSRAAPTEWPAIEISPLTDAALRRMVAAAEMPGALSPALLAGCIRDCHGRPGMFLELVAARTSPSANRLRACAAVAETSPPYTVWSGRPETQSETTTPVLASQVRARQRAADGWRLAVAGRHAPAERTLRDAIGALVRRGDDMVAGRAALNLGRLLLTRGRIAAALDALALAGRTLERTDAQPLSIAVAVFTGIARVEQAAFQDAECVLRAAWLAARHDHSVSLGLAALGLARCLLWQCRFDEARRLSAETDRSDPHIDLLDTEPDRSVMSAALLARIALAERNVHAAGLAACSALERARASGRPFEMAVAARAGALVHAASGDLEGVRAKVVTGLAAARQAHAPLLAIRLRLTEVRALAAARRFPEARRAAQPLERLRLRALPPLLASQVRLAMAELQADRGPAPHARPARGGSSSGSTSTFLPSHEPLTDADPRSPVMDDVIDVLYLCQRVDDDPAALGKVGGMVRERTRATGVAFLGVAGEGLSVIAASGQQPGDWPTALRAVRSGLLIRPARRDHGIEAAAPIRYGTSTVGVLACRWADEGPADAVRAEALLTATAVACAPWVQTALDRQSRVARMTAGDLRLLGVSRASDELRHATARAAAAPFPVLIEGESGSGKELVARAIHGLGPRRDHRFCPVNCAALPDELLESELFGHARGAFTGAVAPRPGLFEDAHSGTLFLDEIAELSARAQAKLLRVLQEGEIRRIGENGARRVDVRVVAATNRSLSSEAEAGRFRRDLLYRLDVVRISVPPLRARVEDIPVLAIHFWEDACRRVGSRASLSSSVLAALARYDWPGNIRELQNTMAALAVSVSRRGSIGPSALPATIARLIEAAPAATLEEARRSFEERFVRVALARVGGHRSRAARELGISRQGLTKLLTRLGLASTGHA